MLDGIRIEHDVPLPGAEPVAAGDVVVEGEVIVKDTRPYFQREGANEHKKAAKEQYKREHLYKLSQQFLSDLRHAWDERAHRRSKPSPSTRRTSSWPSSPNW